MALPGWPSNDIHGSISFADGAGSPATLTGEFTRGDIAISGLGVGSFWIFVPSTVKVGDEILRDPGTTTYANPDWAEWWAAGGKGPTPKVRR